MELTSEQINALVELQQTDLDIAKQRKALDALPYKQRIAELKKKRIGIKDKQIEIQGMREDAKAASDSLEQEDAKLSAKQAESQAAIESAKADYRSVASHSKEIEDASKRRESIAEEVLELSEKLDRMDSLLSRVSQALSALDAKEAQELASYRSEGGALASALKDLHSAREGITARIPSDTLAAYERIAKGKCGVAVSFLVNGGCSACRSSIDPARALQMKRNGRLSTCPHCGRMMIVG